MRKEMDVDVTQALRRGAVVVAAAVALALPATLAYAGGGESRGRS